jgi:Domain of unknown function (DUF4190)
VSNPSPYAVQPLPVRTEPPLNSFAIVGFILSFFVTIAGLVMGIVALVQIKRTGEGGRGLATAAIVLGAVFTFFWIVMFTAAFAIPIIVGQQGVAEDAATQAGLENAKVAMIKYAAHNNGIYPADIIGLDAEGFTQTRATADARIVGGGAGGVFCIQATSQAGHPFHITESSDVKRGSCAP